MEKEFLKLKKENEKLCMEAFLRGALNGHIIEKIHKVVEMGGKLMTYRSKYDLHATSKCKG